MGGWMDVWMVEWETCVIQVTTDPTLFWPVLSWTLVRWFCSTLVLWRDGSNKVTVAEGLGQAIDNDPAGRCFIDVWTNQDANIRYDTRTSYVGVRNVGPRGTSNRRKIEHGGNHDWCLRRDDNLESATAQPTLVDC